jgi:hypothetical protein
MIARDRRARTHEVPDDDASAMRMKVARRQDMPRKQRFKPSRKPKPSLPNEEATNGRPMSNTPSDSDDTGAPSARNDDSLTEPSSDQASR